ncbi:MAG: class I SAM-dependent RNA methyltransferase [Bryobacteraceae bacterium]
MILTPFALPGELVSLDAVTEKPDLVRARVLQVLEASSERVQPRCPYFGLCGGCHYQHASVAYQAAQKIEIVRETLKRSGKVEAPSRIELVAGPGWEYRNRIQLHFEGDSVGFHEAGTHQVVDVDRCAVASPKLSEAIRALRSMMRDRRWPNFLRSMELFTNEKEFQVNVLDSGARHLSRSFFEWCGEQLPGSMSASLDYPVDDLTYRVSHKSFFQVNRFLIEPLVESALGEVRGESALDLYAGVGLFSLPLARRFVSVTSVEAVASAVTDLEFNARRARSGVTAHQANVETFLERTHRAPDFVVADPPRAGLGKKVVSELVRIRPRRLHIVSCDPSTLARDLASLLAGGYAVESMTVVDLFPQTSHIETVTRLVPA